MSLGVSLFQWQRLLTVSADANLLPHLLPRKTHFRTTLNAASNSERGTKERAQASTRSKVLQHACAMHAEIRSEVVVIRAKQAAGHLKI